VTLGPAQSKQFAATLTNSTATVIWTINPAAGAVSSTGLYSAPTTIASALTVTVTASAGGVSATATVSLVPFQTIRVNAGGPAYVDSQGQAWSADYGYTGGSVWSASNPVAGTADAPLYQSQRYGQFSYRFAVPNGDYLVTLKFAEAVQTTVGSRRFNVTVNGAPALSAFDVFAQAGAAFAAIDKTFDAKVSNGQIIIAFSSVSPVAPEVDAIQIVTGGSSSVSGTAPQPAPTGRARGRIGPLPGRRK
jgi:hypothetical protein